MKSKALRIGIIFAIIVLLLFTLLRNNPLSSDQKEIVDLWGYPDQFVITYLPRGEADDPQLVRSETWYYVDNKMEISFLAGDIFTNGNFNQEDEMPSTDLKPEDFDFFISFSDIADIFGETNIIPIDLPVLSEEGEYATYFTDQAIFVIENDYLTYFQTLGAPGELDMPDDEEELQEESQESVKVDETPQLATYSNGDLGIALEYPPEWYLTNNDIVLTTYDPNYLMNDEELPESRLKCDFIKYNSEEIAIKNKEKIVESDVVVHKGYAEEVGDTDGPGLGDSVIFLIQDDEHEDISLICFSYDDSFYDQMLTMFKSVKFTN